MEQPTDSSVASEPDAAEPEVFTIASDDLDELEAIYRSLLMAAGQEKPKGIYHAAQRLHHITVRTRKLLEEL